MSQIIQQQPSEDIKQLKAWIQQAGFFVHPAVTIPDYFDGVQGVGTKQTLPHKTVIMGVPSSKILTAKRCYDSPELKSLFRYNEDFFDYEADQQAQFKILCVFLMYHKMHIEKSPWRAYLKTIAAPQTAIDWEDKQLIGLNKSLIEEILHVRKQCKKVEQQLCQFLKTRKQFEHLSMEEIIQLFRICYKSVLTRCFGYYFSTACLIPVADLMNHHCNSVDHQLIHLDYQSEKGFHETYRPKKNKINCELLGLQKPKQNLSLPFPLNHLVHNNIVQNQQDKLGVISIPEINQHVNRFVQHQLEQNKKANKQINLKNINFYEIDDNQDNDTDSETEYNNTKSIENITNQEKRMMEQFKEQVAIKVEKYKDVEERVYREYPQEKTNDQKKKKQDEKQQQQKIQNTQSKQFKEQIQGKVQENIQQKINEQKINEKQNKNKQSQLKVQNKPDPPRNIQLNMNKCPVQMIPSSSESQSGSEEEQWCLDEACYFTMSTSCPVTAGSQLFNSYGGRTNKFLLVWYGFAYRDNLYDSVTLRMQALFSPTLPTAKDIVLDTYIGGQGRCFRKNNNEEVRPQQVSKQFRFKRSSLSKQLIMYLRLYLLNYYKGQDLYKLFVTFPSSPQFELFMLRYYRDIVMSIYDRYPLQILDHLKKQFEDKQSNITMGTRKRIEFKIIFLEEQRKILDITEKAINAAIKIVEKIQYHRQQSPSGILDKSIFSELPVETLRVLQPYLIQLQENYPYICYDYNQQILQKMRQQNTQNSTQPILTPTHKNNDQLNQQEVDQWEDVPDQ